MAVDVYIRALVGEHDLLSTAYLYHVKYSDQNCKTTTPYESI